MPSPLHVVGEAGARRQLVGEAEVDAVQVRAVGRHVFALGADAEVERQPVVDRPGILEEQAQVVDVDLAQRAELPPRPVAVRAALDASVERRARLIPVERDVRLLLDVGDVVADALELDAAS